MVLGREPTSYDSVFSMNACAGNSPLTTQTSSPCFESHKADGYAETDPDFAGTKA